MTIKFISNKTFQRKQSLEETDESYIELLGLAQKKSDTFERQPKVRKLHPPICVIKRGATFV